MNYYSNAGDIFPGAYWLRSPSPERDERDRRIQFRRSFELDGIPENAEICVTADAKYSLYVNGHCVNFGPARGYRPVSETRQKCYRGSALSIRDGQLYLCL